jgi:hypothetical protein
MHNSCTARLIIWCRCSNKIKPDAEAPLGVVLQVAVVLWVQVALGVVVRKVPGQERGLMERRLILHGHELMEHRLILH